MKTSISVKLQWRCQECGHHHKQVVMIVIPRKIDVALPEKSDYPLVCAACGCHSPLHVSFGGLTGIAINMSGELNGRNRAGKGESQFLSSMVRAAKYPSPN